MANIFSSIGTRASRAYAWARLHKVWSVIIAIVVVGGGYVAYAHYASSAAASQYVIAPVTRGSLTVSVTGSGQVAANQSIDLSPKASGQVTSVNVKAGDTVYQGQTIASVDDTDAAKSLRDAQANLTSAQISYQQSVTSSESSSVKARGDAFSAASTAISDTSSVLKDLDTLLFEISSVPGHADQTNIDAFGAMVGGNEGQIQKNQIKDAYNEAEAAYQHALAAAAAVSPTSSDVDVETFVTAAYTAATQTATAISGTHDIMIVVNDKLQGAQIPQAFTTQLSTVASDESKMNADVSSVFSAKNTFDAAIATLGGSGSTPLDIQEAQLTLTKAQNAVQDAKDNLADYFVTAPFSGTIAKVDVQVYDQASSGTTVATLITNEEYAQLSLNEVDAAKVKDGQKVELTFDAVDGLTLDGTVAEVDSVGTVSSGVVTYDVKIAFDTQNARVKPGMTVNATITTDSVSDVLIVPSSAVTTVGSQSFVQVVTMGASAPASTGFASSTARLPGQGSGSSTGAFARTVPTQTVDASSVTVERVPVSIGISNDTQTEIVSGLTLGQFVVESTKTGTATTAAKSTTTTRGFGAQPAGGAVFRAGG